MSFEAINWALNLNFGPRKSGMKFTLVVMANYADEQGSCYPSTELLATKTEQTRRAVISQINELIAHGHVEKIQRRAGPRQGSNRYILKLNAKVADDNADPDRVKPVHPESGQGESNDRQGESNDRQGESNDAARVKPVHPIQRETKLNQRATDADRDASASPPAAEPATELTESEIDDVQHWLVVLRLVRERIGAGAWQSWFKEYQWRRTGPAGFVFIVRSTFVRDHMVSHFSTHILGAIQAVFGADYTLEIKSAKNDRHLAQ